MAVRGGAPQGVTASGHVPIRQSQIGIRYHILVVPNNWNKKEKSLCEKAKVAMRVTMGDCVKHWTANQNDVEDRSVVGVPIKVMIGYRDGSEDGSGDCFPPRPSFGYRRVVWPLGSKENKVQWIEDDQSSGMPPPYRLLLLLIVGKIGLMRPTIKTVPSLALVRAYVHRRTSHQRFCGLQHMLCAMGGPISIYSDAAHIKTWTCAREQRHSVWPVEVRMGQYGYAKPSQGVATDVTVG